MTQSITIPTVDIAIVNWNAGTQLHDCLASIVKADTTGINLNSVIVIDNASSDDSLRGIEELHLSLKLVRNSANRGFAAACNQGAREGTADYILFLNPDTVLYPDSLTTPLQFMELPVNAQIGIVGIQLIDDAGNVSRSCARFPTVGMFTAKVFGLDRLAPSLFPSHAMMEWAHDDSRDVDQIMGAFYLVRRSLFERLGGLDERFFVYFEEVDFSLRARMAGWRSFYLADARAYHKGCGTSDQIKATRLFYSLRSRILYGFKHFNRISAIALLLTTLFLEPLSRMCLGLARCSLSDLNETRKGFAMLWGALPRLQKSSNKVSSA